ncbi:MAG: glycosyltransferase family 39 protein [Acidobacteria bacterium]|nr:glycosyltransferase family 39 protein [Acidobacteriota bacterium]
MSSITIPPSETRRQPLARRLLLGLALATLFIHLLTNRNYGYFIDELYYLACAEHLDFGYVDHPPIIAVVTWIERAILGDSLPAIRLMPALAGALTVFLAGLLARALGGGRYAQGMAGFATLFAPLLLYVHTILSVNALDPIFWTIAAWLLVLILDRSDASSPPGEGSTRRLWILLGATVGVGLQNKISLLFLGLGLVVGLVLTSHRRLLLTRWPYVAGAIASIIFLPYVLWQIPRGWPTLEFMHNAATYKNRRMSIVEFIAEHALEIHPLNLVLVVIGLWFFFFSPRGKRYRLFGWTYVAILLLFLVQNAKPYYLGSIYPIMLAAGAVGLESLLSGVRSRWPRPAIVGVMAVSGLLVAPITLPVLPIETFIPYQRALLGQTLASSEEKEVGPLPQHFADMFGNEELVKLVAEVYNELPPEERKRCAIYADSYPQAGAIDLFGSRYGLPKAICGHNSYWLWGPGDSRGDIVIVVGDSYEEVSLAFEEVTLRRVFCHPYVMPWRNYFPIYVCRKPRVSLKDIWPETKEFV